MNNTLIHKHTQTVSCRMCRHIKNQKHSIALTCINWRKTLTEDQFENQAVLPWNGTMDWKNFQTHILFFNAFYRYLCWSAAAARMSSMTTSKSLQTEANNWWTNIPLWFPVSQWDRNRSVLLRLEWEQSKAKVFNWPIFHGSMVSLGIHPAKRCQETAAPWDSRVCRSSTSRVLRWDSWSKSLVSRHVIETT